MRLASIPGDPSPERPLVEVREVRKIYRVSGRSVSALDGVSIEVRDGESVGIVGESGSGKTTLARILVGLESATGGEIAIDGVTATDWSRLNLAERRHLRGVIQTVFQDPYSSLNPMHSVGATLSEAIKIRHPGASNISEEVDELLTSVGMLQAHAKLRPAVLSGGQRQRVAIARALAIRPRLLVCDEPLSALDLSVQAQILNLFARLRRERGIGYLFITHDLSIVRQIVDRVYVMHRGRVVESGPVDRVLDDPRDPYTMRLLASIPRSGRDWLRTNGSHTEAMA